MTETLATLVAIARLQLDLMEEHERAFHEQALQHGGVRDPHHLAAIKALREELNRVHPA